MTTSTGKPCEPERAPCNSSTESVAPSPRTLASQMLFAGGNEVLIEHNGAVYTLRLTSKGKLILTK